MSQVTTVALNCDNMINATHVRTQCNIYHMKEHTYVPRRPCFGEDDDDNDATDIQSTHGRSPVTLPATLTVTRIFNHYPTRSLPEVKKPYPSGPAHHM